jgi:autophagy-related protein 101
MMEQRRPPEYILEVFADPTAVKDVVKGATQTISVAVHTTSHG